MKRTQVVVTFGLMLAACTRPTANLSLQLSGGGALGSAAASTSRAALTDAHASSVKLTSAKLHVGDIRLTLAGAHTCAEFKDATNCQGYQVRVAGPFIVDLASPQPIATLASLTLPPASYSRVEIRLDASTGRSEGAEKQVRGSQGVSRYQDGNTTEDPDDDDSGTSQSNDPNDGQDGDGDTHGDHSNGDQADDPNSDPASDPNGTGDPAAMDAGDCMELTGTVTTDQGSTAFSVKVALPAVVAFTPPSGFSVSGDHVQQVTLELDASRWVAALPIAACAQAKSSSACSELQAAISGALQASANFVTSK